MTDVYQQMQFYFDPTNRGDYEIKFNPNFKRETMDEITKIKSVRTSKFKSWFDKLNEEQKSVFAKYKNNSSNFTDEVIFPIQKKHLSAYVAQLTNLETNFFVNHSMTLLENVLAGISLSNAIMGLIHDIFSNIESNFNSSGDIPLSSAMSVCVPWKSEYIVPKPFLDDTSYKVLEKNIKFIGITYKKGTGIIPSSNQYKWYAYTMKIPRANGSVFTMPVLIAYKINNIQVFEKKCFIVCEPKPTTITESKDWTTLSNLWEITFPNYRIHPFLVYPNDQDILVKVENTSRNNKITVSVKNYQKGVSVVKSLLGFVNASTFSPTNFTNGFLWNETVQQAHGKAVFGIVENRDNRRTRLQIYRVPFSDLKKEILWELGFAICSIDIKRYPVTVKQVIEFLYDVFTKSASFKKLVASASVAPASVAPASVAPASVAPASVARTSVAPASVARTSVASASVASASVARTVGGTKRMSKSSRHNKKRSHKKRSHKKRSDGHRQRR